MPMPLLPFIPLANLPQRLLPVVALMMPLAAAPDFVHEVVPILKQHCAECHTAQKKKGGLSMNTEESFRLGSSSGPVVNAAEPKKSLLLALIATDDEDLRMPPKGKGLDPGEIETLKAWVLAGAAWEPGFAFVQATYEPPLRPRTPVLPAAVDQRHNPIDRIIDHYLTEKNLPRPAPLDDPTFLRRVHLDLIGLLPTADEVRTFATDPAPDKRARLVDALLADQTAYAEHWLTFWNDLLRNDYAGTGYIDGGRKQISGWLYQALRDNMPYDQFVRALVAPTAANDGFANGIKWRGTVSAAQSTPLQYAQSVGQTFLGINLKCASCHDSFVDRWKLSEAYGLAAIYSDQPLEMYRCDKPTGKPAVPAWLFPELGTVDASLPKAGRLEQLAALITHPQNGRTPRAICNRLWHRLMGRGIVHPVDAMQSPPWNEDLLDQLAVHLVENRWDLKQTLRLICLSAAYQSTAESSAAPPQETRYVYRGPRPKRLTAEELTDAIWQLCGTAPTKFDAPVTRDPAGKPMVRAALLQSDLLMRTLGRPNREQIVSTRPLDLTTLEAMDLNNGAILDARLAEGARALLARAFATPADLASYVWRAALTREPTPEELALAVGLLGTGPDAATIQDFLWGVLMLPEFQIIR
ncbi:MAG: PSD1 and planctomycete cytochrome C domain-containing protein [Akkermansiaceae bacterium]|nr:PSD1 and planctomycete cytochrome C domain-containing protein [Akkermansiaceae bacterium]MCF7730390.1 PSD1 and planctomycete cytochrome C domain-containing protein [Akkermansiaceae bacterium]